MIAPPERRKMLAVPMCGERVVARLEAIGITALAELAGRDPYRLIELVNASAGHVIWQPPMALLALTNLIEAAERTAPGPTG